MGYDATRCLAMGFGSPGHRMAGRGQNCKLRFVCEILSSLVSSNFVRGLEYLYWALGDNSARKGIANSIANSSTDILLTVRFWLGLLSLYAGP